MSASDHTTSFKRCHNCGNEYPATPEYFYRQKEGRLGLHNQCKNCCAIKNGALKARYWPPSATPDPFKRCTRCHELKPATFEYFYRRPDKRSGLDSHCIVCRRAHQARRRRLEGRSLRRPRITTDDGKIECRGCNQFFPATLEYFAVNKNVSNGLQAQCRECGRKRALLYGQQHPDASRKRHTEWKQANREHVRLNEHKRESRKRMLPTSFTISDWKRALEYFGYCCAVCGRPRGLWHTLAMDHWIPLSDIEHCPGTVPTNMVPLCHGVDGCNNNKKDKNPTEWLIGRFGSRKGQRIAKRIETYFSSLEADR